MLKVKPTRLRKLCEGRNNKRRQHSNTLSPVNSLPTEILRDIFLFAVANSDHRMSPFWAIRLSHVSSYWRNVALGYSELWSWVNIVFFAVHQRRQRSFMKCWLNLLGPAPIYLSIATPPSLFRGVRTRLDRLGLPLDRIRSVMVVSDESLARFTTDGYPLLLPNLESLDMRVLYGHSFWAACSWIADYSRLQVCKVRLAGSMAFGMNVIRSNLRSLHLDGGYSPSSVFEALPKMPALEELTILGVRASDLQWSFPGPDGIVVPSLRTFRISHKGSDGQVVFTLLKGILPYFTFENLRAASLLVSYDDQSIPLWLSDIIIAQFVSNSDNKSLICFYRVLMREWSHVIDLSIPSFGEFRA